MWVGAALAQSSKGCHGPARIPNVFMHERYTIQLIK